MIRTLARVLLASSLLFCACGKDKKTDPGPLPQISVTNTLVFQRSDSTAVTMGTTPLFCCGPYDPGFVNERAMRIVLYDPANQNPGWQILVLIDHAQAGTVTALPTVVVPPSKVPFVSMFAADVNNELSSDDQDSSGSITVHSFSCTATTIQIDFTVDAVLGSEFGGSPPIRVQGSFQGTFPANACQ